MDFLAPLSSITPPTSSESLSDTDSTHITSVGQITAEMRENLKDVLGLAKKRHSPGEVTDGEMKVFLTVVMKSWDTYEYYDVPSVKIIRDRPKSTKMRFGFVDKKFGLIYDTCLVKKARRLRWQPKIGRDQLASLGIDTSGTDPEVEALIANDLYDFPRDNGTTIRVSITETLFPWIYIDNPYRWFITRIHRYNVHLAVFLARNRLVHWVNNNPVATRPGGEDCEGFLYLHPCRDMATVSRLGGKSRSGGRMRLAYKELVA